MQTSQHLLLLHRQFSGTKISSSMGFVWRSVQLRVKEKPQKRVGRDWKNLHESAKMLIELRILLIDTAGYKVKDKGATKGHGLVLKGSVQNPCGTRTISLERVWQKRRGSRRTRKKPRTLSGYLTVPAKQDWSTFSSFHLSKWKE